MAIFDSSLKPATFPEADSPSLWQAVLLTAMAGGMGWGIRGQFGHETGAMIAGVLVSLVLVFLFCPQMALLPAARAAALGAIAMGIGGSMTYGQTIGLTQNKVFVGNWEAWRWGMLGLGLKGAIWIGFGGLFLGMGLGRVRYSWRQVLWLLLGMFALYGLGIWLLNSPHDPANKTLPRIYFSASWHWQPDAGPELKPRVEVWGGQLFALLGAWVWAGWIRRDRLARNLALWGMLGGIGFPFGQCLQSFHAWNPEVFKTGVWAALDPHMNWWNWMETAFGTVMGASLGCGLWLNRRFIAPLNHDDPPAIGFAVEWLLVAVHVALLILGEFTEIRWANALYDPGLIIAFIPLIAVAGGRWWPFLLILPITLIPIAGKMIRDLAYERQHIALPAAWIFYGVLPVLLAGTLAVWLAKGGGSLNGREFARRALLFNAWLYFGLNYAFFNFPWPWAKWTARTPNALAFAVCVLSLTTGALFLGRRRPNDAERAATEPA